MVRREDDGVRALEESAQSSPCCTDPAGASPVSVSGDTPSSRLPARGEILASEAECRKLVLRGGEQVRGPQHEVNPAASSHLQSEGRATHVTAKATPKGLGGVEGAARVQGSVRNAREPSAQPSSRPGASYKPKAKTNTAQRKSEGIVVPHA